MSEIADLSLEVKGALAMAGRVTSGDGDVVGGKAAGLQGGWGWGSSLGNECFVGVSAVVSVSLGSSVAALGAG